MATSSSRNPGIDLLRGFSILLVLIHHVAIRIPLKKGILATFVPTRFLDGLQYNGYEAVFVFFVISGFLITTNSLDRWGDLGSIDARVFYQRRAARILPCLLALVGVLSLLHLAGFEDYHIARNGQTLGRTVLSALCLHLNWYEGHTGWLPGNWDVLWSLSIEEAFYLVFPLFCLALRRNRFLVPVLAVLALSLPATRAALASRPIWQEKAYLPGMGAIGVGILAALAAKKFCIPDKIVQRTVAVLGAFGLVMVFFFEDVLWKCLGNGTIFFLALATAGIMMASRWRSGSRLRPGLSWVQSFGRLSYEIYLTHMFVVYGIVKIFRMTSKGFWWGFLWYVPIMAGAWGLGWLAAIYFSVPVERSILNWFGNIPQSERA